MTDNRQAKPSARPLAAIDTGSIAAVLRRITIAASPISVAVALVAVVAGAQAEQIQVRHPQGSAHGFVEVTTLDGTRIGIGDLLQLARGSTVSSELKLNFFDGSVDDETTLFSQRGVFRLVSDHHIQRGPSFPKSMDAKVDLRKGLVTVADEAGQIKQAHFDMPPDVYNGLASTMLMNVSPNSPETRISIVPASANRGSFVCR